MGKWDVLLNPKARGTSLRRLGEWERKVCQLPLCAWRARGKWGSGKVRTGGHQHSVASFLQKTGCTRAWGR